MIEAPTFQITITQEGILEPTTRGGIPMSAQLQDAVVTTRELALATGQPAQVDIWTRPGRTEVVGSIQKPNTPEVYAVVNLPA